MGTAVVLSLFLCALVVAEFPWTEWTEIGRTSPDAEVKFTMALKLENLDVLNELSERLSTPGSPEYRQWKTIEELNEITRPNPARVAELLSYLRQFGLTGLDYSDFIEVHGRAADVEKAFSAEYHEYQYTYLDTLVIHRSSVHPTIPVQFRDLVMFITGCSNFPHPRRAAPKRIADVGSYYMVPQTLQAQYSVDSSYVASNPNTTQGVVEFAPIAGVSSTDLDQFMQKTDGPSNAQLAYTVGNFVNTPIGGVGFESTLDVQYIMGLAPGVPTAFYVVDGWIYDFTTLIQQRAQQGKPVPLVFSISYGWAEADQCSITGAGTGCGQLGGTSLSYVENSNVGFQKIGMMGTTVFVASGDAGAASKENNDCRNQRTPIQPDYPASSPYVTTVGGTMFKTANTLAPPLPPFCAESRITCAGSGYEIVSQPPESLITSGGGFSNYAPTPSYQSAQVQAYLSSQALLPPSSDFNSSGRAYPDITALAHHFMIVDRGETTAVDGTSASSPLTAAIFSLINDNLLNNNQPPLGFLNPTLYSLCGGSSGSTLVQDITEGNNTTTEKSLLPCTTVGYGATAGWDAVSGFGSPNYKTMLPAIMGAF